MDCNNQPGSKYRVCYIQEKLLYRCGENKWISKDNVLDSGRQAGKPKQFEKVTKPVP